MGSYRSISSRSIILAILLIVFLSGGVWALPQIQVSPAALTDTLDTGQSVTRPFSITNTGDSTLNFAFGLKNFEEIIGLDPFTGYYWIDSDTSSTLSYQWQDISTTGTELVGSPYAGNVAVTVNLSFPFPFFDTRSQVIGVNSNGYLQVGGHTGYSFGDYDIPDSSFGEYKIAAFGDNLSTLDNGQVFFKDEGNRAIFQFQNLSFNGNSAEKVTFQIVLHREGTITFYYKDMTYTINQYTGPSIGIQKDSDDGLDIAFRNTYAKSLFAIQIDKIPNWFYASLESGVLPPGETITMDFFQESYGLNPGFYTSGFTVYDEYDPNVVPVEVTTSLTVSEANYPPNAKIVAPAIANRGETILLDGSQSADFFDGTVVSYSWDLDSDGVFDDAMTATVEHSFTTLGRVIVGLKVTDNLGAVSTTEREIEIRNVNPLAVYTVSNLTPLTGEEVIFDASGSYDLDGTISSIRWYNDVDIFSTDGAVISKTFTDNGTINFELIVWDNDWGSDYKTFTINVQNRPPVAVINHTTAYVGQVVNFDASQSTDADGHIVLYEWSLDGDDVFEATGMRVTQTFSTAGTQNVKLKVTDDDGSYHIETLAVEVTANIPAFSVSPISISLDSNNPNSTLTFENGGTGDLAISFSSGAPVVKGKDRYGYYWTDSNTVMGPAFVWNDISTSGVRLAISDSYISSEFVQLTLFAFPFYGQTYSEIEVSTNGFVTPGDSWGSFDNYIVPSTNSPRNLIAPFWGLLDPSQGGDIYYYEEADRLTIQYNQVTDYAHTGTFTYQIVLCVDGSIYFYYKDMNGITTDTTVGIQNYERTDGMTIAYNESYIQDNLAVQIGHLSEWIKPVVTDLQVLASESATVNVMFDGTGLSLGTYESNLYIHHNDPTIASPYIIPCTFEVLNGAPVASIDDIYPLDPYTNQEVTFTGSGTDSDGTVVLYEWDLDGDGQFDDGVGQSVTFTYADNGNHVVYLRVTDNLGQAGIISRVLTILNSYPEARITMAPANPEPGDTLIFDASASSDLDGNIVSYAWEFGDNYLFDDGRESTVTNVYPLPGHYSVRVRVTDDDGDISTSTLYFEVLDRPTISVDTTSFTQTLPADSSSNHLLNVSNSSDVDLNLTFTAKPTFDLTNIRRGGPDGFGYYWSDSDMPGGPIYRWRDIKEIGAPISLQADSHTSTLNLPFSFPFYSLRPSSITVTSKGYLCVAYVILSGDNYAFPTSFTGSNVIAPFHDDLSPALGGEIYYLIENDRITIQYDNVSNATSTGTYTFQVVIDSTGTMTFYYKDMNGPVDSATVGIQNNSQTIGLTVVHNAAYLRNEFAVRIQTNPGWLKSSLTNSKTLTMGQSEELSLLVNTAGMRSGQYSGNLSITHDAGNMDSPLLIPFDLTITNTAPFVVVGETGPIYKDYPATLDISDSYDIDGDIVNVGWDLDGDGSYTDFTGLSLTHTFTTLGEKILSVQVTDNNNATSTQSITVNVIEPPMITVNPTSFVEILDKSTSSVQLFNISNSGLSDLMVEFSSVNTALAQYAWKDSTMADGPQYVWQDISTTGKRLNTISDSDDRSEEVRLTFDFPFYQINYSSVFVGSNGYLTFGAGSTNYSNGPIPSSQCPANMIAPFYDDLYPNNSGDIYYQDTGEVLIVQYNDISRSSGLGSTYQVVLEKDGSIFFYYNTVNGILNSATIGIQRAQSDGIQVAYNQAYLINQLAVHFEPKHWVTVNPEFATIPAGSNMDISLNFDTSIAHLLSYTGEIYVKHNSPERENPLIIPVTLNVNNAAPIPVITASSLTVLTGETINLNALSSTDADGQIVKYEWDLDNNGTFEDASVLNINTSFAQNGVYPISLRVTDNSGERAVETVDITVLNRVPQIQVTYTPTMPEPGVTITLDASGSTDIDGTIVSYDWDLDGDGVYTDASGVTATTSYDTVSVHTVNLKVIDDDGAEVTLPVNIVVRTDWPKIAVSPTSFTEITNVNTPLTKYLTISNTGGQELQYEITTAYDLTNMIEGGPFEGGYYRADSDTAGGPIYTWNDISLTGKRLIKLSYSSYASQILQLSFSFPFYGKLYSRVNVTTEGHLNLGTADSISSNIYEMPHRYPYSFIYAYLIAPFQTNQVVGDGDVYYLDDGERLIVQYNNVKRANSANDSYTYQVVLEKDGTITFYYKEMSGVVNSAAVGIQNGSEGQGLCIAYNEDYLRDQFAVQIATKPNWIKALSTGTVQPGAEVDVEFTLDPSLMKSNLYTGQLEIKHNGNNTSTVTVPVSMTVENLAPVANITHTKAYAGYPVTFDASTSFDYDGQIVSYGWDTDGDTVYTDQVGLTLTQTYDVVGTYTVSVELTDDDGAKTSQPISVEVVNPPLITVTPGSFTETLAGLTSLDKILNIANTGLTDLQYSISKVSVMGTDAYTWTDSDKGGVEYVWNDITTTGTLFTSAGEWPNNILPLGFDFPYYGKAYKEIEIRNGFISLEQGQGGASSLVAGFPSIYGVKNMIAPYYQYNLTLYYGGEVHTKLEEDRAIIQFSNLKTSYYSSTYTFQIVLFKNGDIHFYYKNISGASSGAVGIQNATKDKGVNIAYNTAYLKDQMAIRLTNRILWAEVTPVTGTVTAGGNQDVNVNLNTVGFMPGTYQAYLEVYHDAPNAANPTLILTEITITNAAPIAVIQHPTEVYAGDVLLDASQSKDVDGTIVSYAWDLDNDFNYLEGSTVNVTKTFNDNGVYPIGLKVVDNEGVEVTTRIDLIVLNRAPVANVTYTPLSPEGGDTVTFDASGSTDSDGMITGYSWDLYGNGTFGEVTLSSTATRVFETVGDYVVQVKIIDNDGAETIETVNLSVVNWPHIDVTPGAISQDVYRDVANTTSLTLTNTGGMDLEFTVDTGYVVGTGEYTWSDSDNPAGPVFVWNDISTTGTELEISGMDDINQSVQLSFAFPFYGNQYSTIYVSTNGFITFGVGSSRRENYPIGNISNPNLMIAALFDDLDNGQLFFKDMGDHAIIQYHQVHRYGEPANVFTYQIVLSKDGKITYYYNAVTSNTFATIGIQKEPDVGLQVAYNELYIKNQLAVYIYPVVALIANPASGVVPAGGTLDVTLTYDAAGLGVGIQNESISIQHNGSNQANPLEIACAYNVLNRLPEVSFTREPAVVYTNQTFTLTSSAVDVDGAIQSYAWDLDNDGFDDGTTANITHSFAEDGDYVVKLQVTDNEGGVAFYEGTVTVANRVPVANYQYTPIAPQKGDLITFDASSSTDQDGTIATYEWDLDQDGFDDGTTATITHAFTEPGDYVVKLRVTDNDGGVAVYEGTVIVTNRAPVATYQYSPITPLAGELITFDASSSTDQDGTIATYEWDFDQDGFDDGTTATITHAFTEPGDYVVKLRVTDNDGGFAVYESTVTVTNRAPVATYQYSPITPLTGELITFDASSSTDEDGTIAIYEWDLDQDGFDDGTTVTITHAFTEDGDYVVKLRVTDNDGGVAVYEGTVTVTNQAPVATYQYSPIAPLIGELITFDASSSTDEDGTIATYEWDLDQDGFDDGTTATITHAFAEPGDYVVKLQVTDNDGGVAVYESTVTVTNRAPVAKYQYTPIAPQTGDLITFDASSTTDLDGTIATYEWDLDQDGVFDDATGVTATTSFADNGTYAVTLRVTDNHGASDEYTSYVTVGNQYPVAAFSIQPTEAKVDEVITLDASLSTDADGSITGYSWDLNEDGIYDDATGQTVQTTFHTAGFYTIRLKVTDNDGGSAIAYGTVEVSVSNVVSYFNARHDVNSVNLVWDSITGYSLSKWTVVRNETAEPSSVTDGVVVYEGIGKAVADSNLPAGTYYYGLFPESYIEAYPAAFVTVTVEDTPFNKEYVIYQSGNGSSYSTTKTAYLWENDLYSRWGTNNLLVGRGVSGKVFDMWIHYPTVIGSNVGQIPTNAQVERAKLTLKVNEETLTRGKKYRLKLYTITDPDGLGIPYFGAQEGYREGLTFQYRDHRLGKDIPWAHNSENILGLFTGVEPTAIVEFESKDYYEFLQEVQFDVTSAVQGWANGQVNQGWFITIEGEWESGKTVEIYGTQAAEISNRPALEVVYSTQAGTIKPDPVSDVKLVSNIGETTITWSLPNSYHAGVKVVRKLGSLPHGPEDGTLVYDGTGTSVSDADYTSGLPYYYALFSYDDVRTYSLRKWIKVIHGTMAAPEFYEPVAGAGYVELSWANIGAVKYRIYRLGDGEGTPICVAETANSYYKDVNVDAKLYKYWIVPINYVGEGQASAVKSATPSVTTTIPLAPTTLDAEAVGNTYIKLAWVDVASDETGYQIERKNSSGNWDIVGTAGFNQISFTDTNLLPNTAYQYRIKVMNSAGSSSYVESAVFVTNNNPVPVTNLNWSVVSTGRVELSWTDSPNEEYNAIYVYVEGVFHSAYSAGKDSSSITLSNLPIDNDMYMQVISYSASNLAYAMTEIIRLSGNAKQDIF